MTCYATYTATLGFIPIFSNFRKIADADVSLTQEADHTYHFSDPAQVRLTDGTDLKLMIHSVARFSNFEDTGRYDLLVASAGRVFWYKNNNDGRFEAKGALQSSQGTIDTGERRGLKTGFAYTDINADGLSDVILSANNKLMYWPNVGSKSQPKFGERIAFDGVTLASDRLDIGDWDGDGLKDVIIGTRTGFFQWHKNTGTPIKASFGQAQDITQVPAESYNRHPRLIDYNRDGLNDLLYGWNWATLRIFLARASGGYRLQSMMNLQGSVINLRSIIGDHTAPDAADVNGDGILDLVTSGNSGKVILRFFIFQC